MKKKLLIYWTSRTFVEVMQPLIPKLGERFRIVIVLLDYSTPPGLTSLLNSWEKEGTIEKYLLTPKHNEMLKYHLFMKSEIKKLKQYNFDLWLSGSEMQVGERYILECVLPEHCVSVCMWHNITYLFMYNEAIVRKLFSGSDNFNYSPLKRSQASDRDLFQRVARKIRQSKSFMHMLRQGFQYSEAYIKRSIKKYKGKIVDRVILPWILTGKTFRFGPYDEMTQLSSGRVNALIFFDEIEAQAHKLLLKTPAVYVAQYPSYGSCSCQVSTTRRTAFLSPLSGYVGTDRIPKEALLLFYRDFKTVLSQTNAKHIHLRCHPDESGKWPQQLLDFLLARGIDASLVDSTRPIREIMCNYLGMAGYASACLRDGRASCNHAIIIGFTGISKMAQFKHPKFVFGKSEGIGWIEEDGSYDPDIFKRHKYIPPKRKTVPEILSALFLSRAKGGFNCQVQHR